MKYIIDDEEIETALRKYLNDNIEIEKKDIEPFLSFFLKSKQPVELIAEGEVGHDYLEYNVGNYFSHDINFKILEYLGKEIIISVKEKA